jgi:hypothetical protein
VKWGSCYGWCLGARVGRLTVPGGLTVGMTKCRAGKGRPFAVRSGVPATRVFSLHVVQAGSALAAGGGRACPDSVQPSW